MFAYDKIWNDNFRNSVVSSPSLDWSDSNSVIFADSWFLLLILYFFELLLLRRSQLFVQLVMLVSDFQPNGWTLEIVTFPRNSQGLQRKFIRTCLLILGFLLLFNHGFDPSF